MSRVVIRVPSMRIRRVRVGVVRRSRSMLCIV